MPEPQDAQKHPRKTEPAARLPAQRKGDGSHGIDASSAPLDPAAFVPAPAPTLAPPPERPVVPVEKNTVPAETAIPFAEELALPAEKSPTTAAELAATAARLATTAAKLAATAAKLAATAARVSASEASRAAPDESPAPAAAPAEETAKAAASAAPEPRPATKTRPAAAEQPETVTLDEAVFDQIRQEIKGRLPYFQACATAARRRGSAEVRRVQATWTIAADGAIKEMKVEGVPDPQLALCITRMGSRPFAVQPGTELTIPTPIVFVQ